MGAATTSSTSASAAAGKPRIIVESANGHRMVVTYEDLVLVALLVGLTLEGLGWLR